VTKPLISTPTDDSHTTHSPSPVYVSKCSVSACRASQNACVKQPSIQGLCVFSVRACLYAASQRGLCWLSAFSQPINYREALEIEQHVEHTHRHCHTHTHTQYYIRAHHAQHFLSPRHIFVITDATNGRSRAA